MKRKLTSCLLVAGFMLATAPSAFATTYFIKVDGSDDTDGSSWEQAISYDYFAENMEQGNFADGDVFCFAGGTQLLWCYCDFEPMSGTFVLPVECINCPLPISTNI